MFGYPEYTTSGEKILTTREGIYKDMMMDIRIYKLKAEQEITFHKEKDEAAYLLVNGSIEYSWNAQSVIASRNSCFEENATCLHVPKNTKVTIKAFEDTELLVQATENEKEFASKLYKPKDIVEMTAGLGLCNDVAIRQVKTIFDYTIAPYSNMVLGEIVARQGAWSSYTPHQHPQPEVYYYHFDRPQGFGGCFIGDNVFKIKDGSFCAIPGGLTHPQVSAPGYRMYTCWMIRHFDHNPWTDRIDDPEHTWMIGQKF